MGQNRNKNTFNVATNKMKKKNNGMEDFMNYKKETISPTSTWLINFLLIYLISEMYYYKVTFKKQ